MGNADEELQLFLQCDCAISSDGLSLSFPHSN